MKRINGLYQISNLGRVKALSKFNKTNSKYSSIGFYRKEKILKNQKNKYGYMYVQFYKNKKSKYCLIHRLVALAFIDNSKKLPEVNHIDGNKSNNNLQNLEWISKSDNEKHAYLFLNKPRKNGSKGKFGKDNSKSKKVFQIDKNTNEILNVYYGIGEAERITGICNQQISKCCLKRKGYLTAGGYKWRYANED